MVGGERSTALSNQLWTLKAKVTGNFFLVSKEELTSYGAPHQSVKRFVLDPDFDDNNRQTGKFNLEVDFVVDSDEEKPPSSIPADLGKDLLVAQHPSNEG